MTAAWQGLLGIGVFIGLAWALSENRRAVNWHVVAAGLSLQVLLAVLLLRVPPVRAAFASLNDALLVLEQATRAGTAFVFGHLGGGPLPYIEQPGTSSFVLAFRALPLVLVMSALSALLFHWRVLPWVVRILSQVLERTLGVGGALGLSVAANVFVGMVEAPLLVRPYLAALSRGELFALMVAGMATIAGTVLALYASILGPVVPDALGHLLIASLISTPAAVFIALLMVPAQGAPAGGALIAPQPAASSMDAITQGTLAGVELLINIVALLLVMVALVHLANAGLGLLPDVGGAALSLERLLGWVFAPVAWLMGLPWSEAVQGGALLGVKTVLNELLAYLQLAALPPEALSPRSRLILTYALCGFANLGSLGIMIGGLAVMAPQRRAEIVGLGMKSILAGTLATCLTGALVGLLV
jgi:CNT family concentrative nucleoside transporter